MDNDRLFLMEGGMVFHIVGAEYRKAREAIFVDGVEFCRTMADDDRRVLLRVLTLIS